MKEVKLVGIDLAKSIFHLHGMDRQGNQVFRKKLSRKELSGFMRNFPVCIIAMEACAGSQYWGRLFRGMGHEVKLIAPQFVKPFVKSNKNDWNDAEAICEAAIRPSMRFVTLKEQWQQDLQCAHRVRTRLIQQRTALLNETRAFIHENGVVVSKGIAKFHLEMANLMAEEESKITPQMKFLVEKLLVELSDIQKRIIVMDAELKNIARTNEICKRVQNVNGIGWVTSTALVAAAGNAKEFKNGRQFAAWLGLVPRQHSTGGKQVLLGISKRGDRHIRAMLIQGARAVMQKTKNKEDYLSRWVEKKRETRGPNKACVALANKNARMAWAMMAKEEPFRIPKQLVA